MVPGNHYLLRIRTEDDRESVLFLGQLVLRQLFLRFGSAGAFGHVEQQLAAVLLPETHPIRRRGGYELAVRAPGDAVRAGVKRRGEGPTRKLDVIAAEEIADPEAVLVPLDQPLAVGGKCQ